MLGLGLGLHCRMIEWLSSLLIVNFWNERGRNIGLVMVVLFDGGMHSLVWYKKSKEIVWLLLVCFRFCPMIQY